MTPTALVLSAGRERLTVTDHANRVLVVRRLNALDKLRLLKAAGPVLSENQAWLGVAMLAASVVEIDGVPVPLPTTEQQIEGLVGRLGDDGLDAVAALLAGSENSGADMSGNLPGTPI